MSTPQATHNDSQRHSPTHDTLHIRDLAVRLQIGWSEEERRFPQRVLISLDLNVDTRAAAKTRDLSDSVCYIQLREQLVPFLQDREWILIEELASAIAEFSLRFNSLICGVSVHARKFVVTDAAWVGISIHRTKADFSNLERV